MKESRPWGTYEILLDDPSCKVKKIIVNPGQCPSYQYHYKRSEHWVITSGEAEVCLDDKTFTLKSGDSVYIPKEARHTIKNTTDDPLEFIEVQTGTYFGEDDIVRLKDNYGRA